MYGVVARQRRTMLAVGQGAGTTSGIQHGVVTKVLQEVP